MNTLLQPAPKKKFPRAQAIAVAREMVNALKPCCERLIIAGSLRRGKTLVGDVEVLYIPKFADVRDGLFDLVRVNLAQFKLGELLVCGVLSKRLNVVGAPTWGPKNKLALHVASQIPVDFFEVTAAGWFNYLVCRTGSAENNIHIATAAQSKGWKWHPYGGGFTDEEGNPVRVESEEEVYRLVGLPYLEPWQR